jgi:lipopolysaccharide transport system permease protein
MSGAESSAVRQSKAQLWWLFTSLTRRDLAQRYRGTALGSLWPFLYAAILLAVFTFVFSVILKVRWSTGTDARPSEGALMIFTGLVPFLFLSEVLIRAPSCVAAVPNFVKKVRFPLALLPAVVVGSAALLALVNSLILVIAVVALWSYVPATAALLPLIFLPLALLGLGIAFLLASLGVFFRDLAQITPLLAQLVMFLAPVCYPASIVPPAFADLVAWNPLTWFLNAFRDLALDGRIPPASEWLVQTLTWFAFALLGLAFFWRTRRMFADLM